MLRLTPSFSWSGCHTATAPVHSHSPTSLHRRRQSATDMYVCKGGRSFAVDESERDPVTWYMEAQSRDEWSRDERGHVMNDWSRDDQRSRDARPCHVVRRGQQLRHAARTRPVLLHEDRRTHRAVPTSLRLRELLLLFVALANPTGNANTGGGANVAKRREICNGSFSR